MCVIKIVLTLLSILYCIPSLNGLVNSPKIIAKDGHLIFESGLDRNITFILKGKSRLNINDEFDVIDLLLQSKKGRLSNSLTSQTEWTEVEEAILKQLMTDITSLKTRVFGPAGLETRYRNLTNTTNVATQWLRRYKTRIQRLETRIQSVSSLLEEDHCLNNPCQNAGTCLNMYTKFACKCLKNFEGPTCAKDVNECAVYAGTDLGCQNGAQCVNQFGSYSCICSPGFFGIHCTQRKGDCMQSSAWELCGHGTCVSSNDTNGYKCICDQGWKTNGLSPACSVDVDECADSHTACVTKCINLPGSFTCAPCAAGLTGNGVSCRDIDECATHNGGCSLSPKVPCINSYGSYHCGECPLGWSGNGRTCERSTSNADASAANGGTLTGAVTTCATGNICHPLAKCHEISNTVVCSCPVGMVGSGIGFNGCIRGTAKNCINQPCLNGGTCLDTASGFECICPLGYTGKTCTPLPSPCSPNPCHNNGRCRTITTAASRSFSCQCNPGYRGEKCEKQANSCGGVLAGTSGRLTYPTGSPYNHNTQCAWVIKTNETLVLNVTFASFDLEDSTECRFDWLQINDGRSAASQIVGRFCGNHKPNGGNIISSTHQLYLWFRSDNSTSNEGFDLEWNSIPPQCGGIVNVTQHGTISSPGSPGNYPKNRDCRWTLKAPFDKRLKLTFFSLQIEKHDSCNYDYVEITDAISGETLEKYCNSTNPQPILLPTNEAIIHFHSDNIGSDLGFQIFYTIEERRHNCGGVFTANEGTIQSPYIQNEAISCEYEIRMANSQSITIMFVTYTMGEGDCVEIYDVIADTNENILQAKYCGAYEGIPPIIHSQYNRMILKFYGKLGAEFKLQYKSDCSYNYESPEGVIVTPNYPKINNIDRYCTYKIMTEPNTVISLHVDDFDLKDTSLEETDCAYTSLKIYNDLFENLGPYCGENAPAVDILSKTNMLMLHYRTGITSTGRGFKITYKAVAMGKTECGGVYTKPGYSIRLPTTDGSYMHNMECYWIIMAPKDKFILLNWKSFDLEESSDCNFDYVEIRDNLVNTENNPALARFCDSHRPESFLSHSRMLVIKFVSDQTDEAGGFEFNYEFIDASQQCGGKIHSSTGIIHTPNWPLNYTGNLDCTWIINTPPGTQMELQIEVFELELQANCSSDWLEIRNGGSNHSTLLGRFCGNITNIPHSIPSFTSQMFLSFHSDAFVNLRGMQISWIVLSNSCGGNLEAEQGIITSPFYPEHYPNKAECEWRIHVHPGSAIHLTVEDIALEIYSNCRYDILEISEGSTGMKPFATLCQLADNKPQEFLIDNHEALIHFQTDDTNRERGFKISYRANCSVTLIKNYGVIESPNFGIPYSEYNDDVHCAWTLKAPKGNRIQIEFTFYDTVNKKQLLDIRDGNNVTYSVLSTGQSINSSSDTIVIQQTTNELNFQLEYAMVGCIEVFHAEKGEFKSPNYPKSYSNNMECLWEITTQPGLGIELTVTNLDMEESVNCTRDALVISSDYRSFNPRERHCGQHNNLMITSSSHTLYVRFYSDNQGNGKGFEASYITKKSACGGVLTSKNGLITSPNYPNNYPENSDCEWTITVSPHHVIILTMEELDMEDFIDCDMDYVEAFEETGDTNRLQLFKKCGTMDESGNNTWRSLTNTVTVRFHTDESIPAKGFKLSFVEDCGERMILDESDLIEFEITKHILTNKTCEWQLIAKDPTKHVVLSFSHIQLNPALENLYQTEGGCLNKGAVIYDGISDSSPVRSKFCKLHPPDIISNGHALTLKVPMGIISEIQAYGYLMDNLCGGAYRSLSGKFATPYYPSSYPVNIQCLWTIQASKGNKIALTFESMDLEDSDDCNNDYVEVRADNDLGQLLGLFCGNKVPAFLEGAETLAIRFNSNNDIVGEGFMAKYSYMTHNEVNGTNGIIESPAYPAKFHSQSKYSWRITVPKEFVVLLSIKHIVDLDIPFIKFYDGYADIGAEISYADSHVIRTNTNILFFTASRGPFQFEWEQLSKDVVRSNQTAEKMSELCGSQNLLINNEIIFNSPGYPNGYEQNLHCQWNIIPNNKAEHAELSFSKIDLEEFDDCFADYVKVWKSNDLQNWQELAKMCKKTTDKLMKYQGTPYLKLEFVTDSGINKTGFSSTISTKCGAELTGRRGDVTQIRSNVIGYPQVCVWTIKVRQGRRIRITFSEFFLQTPNTENNCKTYFLVRNGMAEDSPFLGKGKYCDNNITDILETSSNRAYIKYHQMGFQASTRASFHYEELSQECSREIVLNDNFKWNSVQTIMTPNHPNIPNPHSECIWKITAPLFKTITLDFLGDFDLIPVNSGSQKCELEYVQINDGNTEMSTSLGKYCGKTKPNTIQSSGNVMRVIYFTDVSEPHKGFQANVSISKCGGSYYNPDGIIKSPMLQLKQNEKELECVYTIETALGSTIDLSVDNINMPEEDNDHNIDCKDETHLELQEIDAFSTDVENITDTLFICGSRANRYIVETNKMKIILRIKNGFYTYNSFQISYSTIGSRCGETIVNSRGILQTPNYPRGTGEPLQCSWELQVPKGKRIKAEFLDFDMGVEQSYGHVYRRIIFNNDFKMTSIITRVTDSPPAAIYSTDNTMSINALLLSFNKYRGFKLKFSSDEDSIYCGQQFLSSDDTAVMGKTHSLVMKRDNNSTSVYCAYDLTPSPNHTLSIQIVRQETYPSNINWFAYGCQYKAAIMLYAGEQRILPMLLCRNETQPSFRLPFSTKLALSAHKRNNVKELELQYTYFKCGGVRNLRDYTDFSILQPNMNNYTGRLECAWVVWRHDLDDTASTQDPPNFDDILEDVHVDISLTTDFKGKCEDEYLIIYNGPNQNFPHLGRYCAQSSITNVVVSGGLFMEFITQNYNNQSKFNLSIHEGSGCGGVLKYPYRHIIFDYQYKNNVECIWELSAEPGFHLAAVFERRFFIESSPNCTKDYLKIQQRLSKTDDWQDINILCGRTPPAAINTTGTEMRLIFHSDESTTGDGFTVSFERNCGGILYASATMQQVFSPNYPKNYLGNLNCNYTIVHSSVNSHTDSDLLYVRFIDFLLEDDPRSECKFDSVTIYASDQFDKSKKTTICGNKSNYEVRSKNKLSVIFKSDASYERKGFLMEYGYNKCSTVITNSTIIESPKDSTTRMFPHFSKCSWQLQAPDYYKILIKFEQFDFESEGSCLYDVVEIYKGLNTVDDQRLAKLCGNLTGKIPVISIEQNTALIYAYSDERDPSHGFRALVQFIPNCDRHIYLDSSNSSYEFNYFSGQYANNLDCSWVFKTSTGRQFKIEFATFHVENSTQCLDDYLEIRDGSGIFSDLIGKFCGHDIPQPLVLSGSNVLMRFVSDSQGTSSGFTATIKTVPKICGQQVLDLKTKTSLTLTSPDDGSGKYPNNINCIWKIEGTNNMHLHFEKLDIEGPDINGSCSTDYIKIINNEDFDVIDKGYGTKLVFNGRPASPYSFHYSIFDYGIEHIYCGNRIPDDYFSKSKTIFVKFRTNSDQAKTGFKLKATEATGCFRNFTGTQGRIKLSESSDHCDIYIKSPANTTLSLYYNEVMFSEYDCNKESIEVFDALTNTSLGRACEFVEAGKSIFSNTNELLVHLKLSGYFTQVDLTYLASTNGPGCGGDLYNTNGVITNPFYPTHIRNNSDCLWNIRVPSNTKVLLKFIVFNMGAKSTCRTDYLQIIEYENNDVGAQKVVRQFCGEDNPRFYQSAKSYVTVRFHKTVNYDGTGWVMTFNGVPTDSHVINFEAT